MWTRNVSLTSPEIASNSAFHESDICVLSRMTLMPVRAANGQMLGNKAAKSGLLIASEHH
jgi:hypothetical protein